MSIASKQSELLGSGVLSELGSIDKGSPLPLNKTARALVDMAAFLITKAQQNLNSDGTNATGDLEESMHVENLAIDGSRMSVDVVILDRYKFVNDGVKGVQSGKGKYQFKTIFPNKKMATALLLWLRGGKNKTRTVSNVERAVIHSEPKKRKTEIKNLKQGAMVDKAKSLKSLAYATAVAIKKHGIKPTKFFTKAVKETEKEWKKELAKGFKIDIIESLKNGN